MAINEFEQDEDVLHKGKSVPPHVCEKLFHFLDHNNALVFPLNAAAEKSDRAEVQSTPKHSSPGW